MPGISELARWEIKNCTIQVYCKATIIDEFKKFIDASMSASYTYKIKIRCIKRLVLSTKVI
jgi:hypothetical protein